MAGPAIHFLQRDDLAGEGSASDDQNVRVTVHVRFNAVPHAGRQ